MINEDKINEIHEDVKYIRKILLGNGDPKAGLVMKTAMIESSLAKCQAERKDRGKANTAIIVAVIAACATIAGYFFK